MIKREKTKDGKIKLTFVQQYSEQAPVFVLGDFNSWDPSATKLLKRTNGTASATVTVDPNQKIRFRYRSAEGIWFNDEAADTYEKGEAGDPNSIINV
ncbi:MAG: isoamylase early set domain-containing protein [Caldilineaceae bacterium]